MTRLSVNINKIATLRNARGGNNPNLLQVALDCERFGAQGITVHPRPDERHIRYADVHLLKENISTELNIEGNPTEAKFVQLVLATKPTQVTLVPDAQNNITSNTGWDTLTHQSQLTELVVQFNEAGIRTSIFVDANPTMVEGAKATGTQRIELYTEPYAEQYPTHPAAAIASFISAALRAKELGLGLNAGHDLSLQNLRYFAEHIPFLQEVSIGHALVCDALYYGLQNTIQLYLKQLDPNLQYPE
jgi:pyridoxine 5-phosphate synthase